MIKIIFNSDLRSGEIKIKEHKAAKFLSDLYKNYCKDRKEKSFLNVIIEKDENR